MSFNLPGEVIRVVREIEHVAEFYGINIERMPVLLSGKEGDREVDVPRTPLGSSQFLQWRIDAHKAYKKAVVDKEEPDQVVAIEAVRNKRWDTYADTATLWVRHPDRGGVIVPYDGKREGLVYDILSKINPQAPLVDRALDLTKLFGDGIYDAVRDVQHALTLSSEDIKRLEGKPYAHGTVKDSLPWVALADGSKDRVGEYDEAFHELTGRDLYMAQFFGHSSKGKVTGRLWYVDSRYNSSDADSNNNIDNNDGRLFGVVAPEALGAEKIVVSATLDDVLAFSNAVPDLSPVQRAAYEAAARAHYTGK